MLVSLVVSPASACLCLDDSHGGPVGGMLPYLRLSIYGQGSCKLVGLVLHPLPGLCAGAGNIFSAYVSPAVLSYSKIHAV